jgi:hypothetical protein
MRLWSSGRKASRASQTIDARTARGGDGEEGRAAPAQRGARERQDGGTGPEADARRPVERRRRCDGDVGEQPQPRSAVARERLDGGEHQHRAQQGQEEGREPGERRG